VLRRARPVDGKDLTPAISLDRPTEDVDVRCTAGDDSGSTIFDRIDILQFDVCAKPLGMHSVKTKVLEIDVNDQNIPDIVQRDTCLIRGGSGNLC